MFIFFCIGLPTFLMGCNSNISKTCIAYNPYQGVITKHVVDTTICKKCVAYNSKNICKEYSYYTCYNAYVFAHQNDILTNLTKNSCWIQTASDVSSKTIADHSTYKWKIYQQVNWYQKKNSHECETGTTVLSLWYTGIVFLSLTGLVIFVGIILFVIDGLFKYI